MNFNGLDMYQKSHFRRYEFAKKVIQPDAITGDFACGTGYGSIMLSEVSRKVTGVDIDSIVIEKISKRYNKYLKVQFVNSNLLDLKYEHEFDNIVSFETVEHLEENNIPLLFSVFSKSLKPGGRIVFSTPYMQVKSKEAIKMGFHLTFDIDEKKINNWLENSGFQLDYCKYQNYESHSVMDELQNKDFIICVAIKK
jgi:2-polyprenyl-3-methyl-5-hydroxy-6-metoxy-1,4-benzoquinol methylase